MGRHQKLAAETRQKIAQLHAEHGISMKDLAERFGVSAEHVRRVLRDSEDHAQNGHRERQAV